jgi:tripartite-type tricarboxylate transporter receptor subunit TctC
MILVRCIAMGLAALSVLLLPAVDALGQTFPGKPIRFVVPYGPGGLPDVMARLVAQKLSESMGQPVNVENKPGASGIIAAEFVAKSEPDGYTLLVGDIAQYALNPALRQNLPYDTLRDLTPITQALRGPLFLMVNAGLGVKSVAELVALAKTRPGINYGSSGNASVHQLGMEQFALLSGTTFQHIPYKGVAQAVPAMIAGDTQLMFVSPTSAGVGEQVKAGKVLILAVASSQRWAQLPNVPTMAEAGYAVEAVTNIGFFTRMGTPPAVVAKLHAELVRALKSPDVESKMPGLGAVVVAGTPEEFTARIRADQVIYAKLVKEVRVTVD